MNMGYKDVDVVSLMNDLKLNEHELIWEFDLNWEAFKYMLEDGKSVRREFKKLRNLESDVGRYVMSMPSLCIAKPVIDEIDHFRYVLLRVRFEILDACIDVTSCAMDEPYDCINFKAIQRGYNVCKSSLEELSLYFKEFDEYQELEQKFNTFEQDYDKYITDNNKRIVNTNLK